MTDTKTVAPSFVVSHEAWYWNTSHALAGPEIMIGDYCEDGSIGGEEGYEFGIRWIDLQGQLCPRVEMFSDSWQAFLDPTVGTLFTWLAQNRGDLTPDQVKQALLDLGFRDVTNRGTRKGETEP